MLPVTCALMLALTMSVHAQRIYPGSQDVGSESNPSAARGVLSNDRVCNLPKVTGFCRASIPSFYYNTQSGQCEAFAYGGCGGNANRFRTQAQCENNCIVTTASNSNSNINSNARVLLSNDRECNLPKVTGSCRGYFPSFYYSTQSGQCETFVYGGCRGNANRFRTQALCQNKCIATTASNSNSNSNSNARGVLSNDRVCNLPKVTGPCRASIPSFYYNTQSGQCETFVYGGCRGNANRFRTQAQCQNNCTTTGNNNSNSGVQDVGSESNPRAARVVLSNDSECNLPKVTGPCRASIPSFYYNTQSGQCETFVYGGCRGNANRFRTQAQCQNKCTTTAGNNIIISDSVCLQPMVRGRCRASHRRWYFNTATMSCTTFRYGGCRGNDNRFLSQRDCLATCRVVRR